MVEETTRFVRQMGGAPVCILAFQYKPDYDKTDSSIVQSVAAASTTAGCLAKRSFRFGSIRWDTIPMISTSFYPLW